MKTSELTRSALDWAVAQANGDTDLDWFVYEGEFYFGSGPSDPAPVAFMPSRNWFDGGPIIERKWLDITPWPNESDEELRWQCKQHDSIDCVAFGPTPLIAAMRCYVASVLGDEIDTPDGL